MSEQYSIGRLRGELCLTHYDDSGKRHRYGLGTRDPHEAERRAPSIVAELKRPRGTAVAALWQAYLDDKSGRAVTVTMGYTWKALKDRFGPMAGDAITVEDCRAHVKERRKAGIQDGTIHTELGHLRMVLLWAKKQKLIADAPHIERPSK